MNPISTILTSVVYPKSEDVQEQANRSSFWWKCTSRIPDGSSGGYIYKFDYVKHPERPASPYYPYPAVEPDGGGLDVRNWKVLRPLGYYHDQDSSLNLPDRVALLGRWNLLRSNQPELPELTIIDSEGVAGDAAFIQAYIETDGILSTGIEFVHDNSAHIALVLGMILEEGWDYYKEAKLEFLKKLSPRLAYLKQIENEGSLHPLFPHLPILRTMISAVVDLNFPYNTASKARSNLINEGVVSYPLWVNYLTSHYGHNQEFYSSLWKQFSDPVVKIYNESIKTELKDRLGKLIQIGKTGQNDQVELSKIFDYSPQELEGLNKWLQRLTDTLEFRENSENLSATVCSILRDVTRDNEFRAKVFELIDENNNSSDIIENGFTDVFRKWQYYQASSGEQNFATLEKYKKYYLAWYYAINLKSLFSDEREGKNEREFERLKLSNLLKVSKALNFETGIHSQGYIQKDNDKIDPVLKRVEAKWIRAALEDLMRDESVIPLLRKYGTYF